MNVLFDKKPTTASVLFIITIWLFLIWMAICFSGCKSRKVQKDYSKSVDKTETGSTRKESLQLQDTAKTTIQNNIKESYQSNKTFDTEQTTVINYDTLGRIKNATIIKKSKGQNLSNSDKSDQSKIDFISGHSEIKGLDSTGFTNKDKKYIVKAKKVETKDNTIYMWVGFGFFLVIIAGATLLYLNYKNKKAF